MQTLSAYLLESPPLDATQLAARISAVESNLIGWLEKKGAPEPTAASGEFESLTKDGSGSFVRQSYATSEGKLDTVRLEEFTRAGQIFTTQVTATAASGRVAVHCTLGVANAATIVAPMPVDPRCPSIIRSLLDSSADWQMNGWPLASAAPTRLVGHEGGSALADDIRNIARSVPLVVVSEIEDEQLWPDLSIGLAFDLAALARVVTIDDEATWALSDQVGKLHSCYRGAVRLYWPPRKRANGTIHFSSTVWTASELLSNDQDGKGLNRLRSTLRRTLMSTAALAISAPAAAREIETAVARSRIAALEERASVNSEELDLARLYAAENEELKTRVAQLESDLARAASRAAAAEHSLSQLKGVDLSDEEGGHTPTASDEPQPGDTRYYKKTHSKGSYDVLVEVQGCDHTAWQGSAPADKAKKGLERLTGRSDWKSLMHCGSCTGGGMWKVRW